MALTFKPVSSLKILDFDIENRPLSYLGMDFTTSEITAIAAGFADEKKVECFFLNWQDMKTDRDVKWATIEMLESFRKLYDQADVVTGHYIRMHDLPIINSAMIEQGLPKLSGKRSCDTKMDLMKFKGVSKSQESLGMMLSHHDGNAEWKFLSAKEKMGQDEWRRANRLTIDGVTETTRRVIGDVNQHKQLRLALIKAGALGPMKVWRP